MLSAPFDRSSSALRCLLACAIASAALLGGVIAVEFSGLDYRDYFRDSAVSDVPFAGAVSNLGILLMGVAALAALAVGMKASSRPHLFLGVFAALFVADDAAMLHERLGGAEVLFIAVHGLTFALAYIGFRRLVIWPLLFAGGCFAVSVVVDQLPWLKTISWVPYYLLEDGAKFCGILMVALFAVSEWNRTRIRSREVIKRGE